MKLCKTIAKTTEISEKLENKIENFESKRNQRNFDPSCGQNIQTNLETCIFMDSFKRFSFNSIYNFQFIQHPRIQLNCLII